MNRTEYRRQTAVRPSWLDGGYLRIKWSASDMRKLARKRANAEKHPKPRRNRRGMNPLMQLGMRKGTAGDKTVLELADIWLLVDAYYYCGQRMLEFQERPACRRGDKSIDYYTRWRDRIKAEWDKRVPSC